MLGFLLAFIVMMNLHLKHQEQRSIHGSLESSNQ
jgi:hypothetical protein